MSEDDPYKRGKLFEPERRYRKYYRWSIRAVKILAGALRAVKAVGDLLGPDKGGAPDKPDDIRQRAGPGHQPTRTPDKPSKPSRVTNIVNLPEEIDRV